jgi:hypothetical protein
MRILVDATPLLLRSAGVKTYIHSWLQHLSEHAGNDQILTFPNIGTLSALNHERRCLVRCQPSRIWHGLVSATLSLRC